MRSSLAKNIIVLTTIVLSFSVTCNQYPPNKRFPKAVKGVLDLTGWDFKRDGVIDLSGEYEFYWSQLLTPSEFSGTTPPQPSGFIEVPGYWNGYEIKGHKVQGHGYATYRLKILLHDAKESLSLKLLSVGTAYTVYVNGKKICSAGIAGKDRASTVPRYFPQIVDFKVEASPMEMIVQVSNYHHRRGGIWEDIKLGEVGEIGAIEENRLAFDLFLFGSILIMGLYHLCLFMLRKKDQSPLYFGIFCFLVALRLLSTGERYLIHLLPDTPWEMMVKLEYLSFYLSIPVFVLYVQSLFPREISKQITNIIVVLGLGFSAAVTFLPASMFTYTLPVYQIITCVAILYGLYVIIIASIRKRDGAFIVFLGFAILGFSAINDILYVEKFIHTGYFAPFGLFIFIFSQAFIISLRFSKACTTAELQFKELKETYQAYRGEIIDRVHAEKTLHESEKKYRAILNSMEDGYYEVDLSGNLTFVNPAICRHFGYSKEELIGMNNRKFMTEDTAIKVFDTFNEVYRTGKPALAYDWETVAKDGTRKFIETSVALMRGPEGQPIGFRGVGRDITERKRAEEQERLHQEQLFQAGKMVALGTLVSGVAHEINNPNNFIRLNTPTLKEAWEGVIPILEEYYENNGDFMIGGMKYTEMRDKIPVLFSGIRDGSERIMKIVEDLKNFIRKDLSDRMQAVDVNEVLKSAVSLISNMIKKSTRRFSVEYARNLPALSGNFQRLEQVMINLIQNACQALPDRKKGIFVATFWDQGKNRIVIKIKDEGVGISSENISRIMDPFFTTKKDKGGVGLGLSISSKIVESHGGTMTFASETGKGTTVEVALPLNQKDNTLNGVLP